MDIINEIPLFIFEVAGIVVGLVGCLAIAAQLYKEYKTKTPSSLSLGYVVSWTFIFLFWFFYGLRTQTFAIIITNSIATVLQGLMWLVVLIKYRKAKKQLF